MSSSSLLTLVARCRSLCRPRSNAPDAELLTRFAQRRDTAAFEELLERYAPMVWGVCRRIAPTEIDGEDAFQATFLALVKQASRLDGRQPLGAWLHTVAARVSRKAATRSRKQITRATLLESGTPGDIADEVGSRELFRRVDEEIDRLPASVRLPLIMCCLQGKTRDEAAEALGCSVAAVKSRLERGRNTLRLRLQERGVHLPAAFLVLGLTTERVRAALWAKTMQTVLYTPAPGIIALAEAGISSSVVGKCKLLLAALLLVSSVAGTAGTLRMMITPEQPPTEDQSERTAAESKKARLPQVRRDRYGDPLPDRAIARLGTIRWRHGFMVYNLAYSPDGKMIAAVGCGRAITLWDAATGKEIHQFPNGSQPQFLAFSPDGKMLATTFVQICTLWDIATGKELRQLKGHTSNVCSIAFAPDGKTLATSSTDRTARIWDTATGKELRRLECKQGFLYAAAYSSDGKLLATGGADGTIRLWDSAMGKERYQLDGHKKAISQLAFSSDGKQLASASEDETIRLWDVAAGGKSRVLGEKLGEFRLRIAFSPNGKYLALGQGDGTIRLWDPTTGTEKRRWQVELRSVMAIAFSPDGKTLAASSAWGGGIRQWDVATGKEKHPSDEHHGFVDFLRFSADGTSLISLGRDRCMLRWDLTTTLPQRLFSWTYKRYSGCALSPDGNLLAANGWPESHLRLWDVRTGKPVRELGKPRKEVFWQIAFSPDGRLVASEGDDQMIHVWDVSDGKEVRQIKGFQGQANRLCFSPDGKALASSMGLVNNRTGARTLQLWDISTGKERCSFDYRAPGIGAIAFSPDGKKLASGSYAVGKRGEEASVYIWDTASGAELCRHPGHKDSVSAIAFSADGKLVVSGTGSTGYNDNSVHVWEAATGRLIRRFEGHHSCVGSVAFAPDGLSVASGAGDSTILLWDITGRRADGRWHAKPLTPRQSEECWTALANEDAAKSYDAVWMLVAAPEQAVPFLGKRLPPVPRPDAEHVARMIADLDSDNFMVRNKATQELRKRGDAILPDLRRELEKKPSLEVRRRIQQLLDQTRDWTPERLRDHRAIQALEHIGTLSAREILQALAAGAPESQRTEEAKAALRRLIR